MVVVGVREGEGGAAESLRSHDDGIELYLC